jgi:hypothetical protein
MEKKQSGRLTTQHKQSQGVVGVVLEIIYGVFFYAKPCKNRTNF